MAIRSSFSSTRVELLEMGSRIRQHLFFVWGQLDSRHRVKVLKEITFDESRPAMTNLLTMYQLLNEKSSAECVAHFAGKGYGQLKSELAEATIEFLRPFQDRVKEYDDATLNKILRSGAEKARTIASVTLADIYTKTGIR